MEQNKHTPGPWAADGRRIKAYKDNGYTKVAVAKKFLNTL